MSSESFSLEFSSEMPFFLVVLTLGGPKISVFKMRMTKVSNRKKFTCHTDLSPPKSLYKGTITTTACRNLIF